MYAGKLIFAQVMEFTPRHTFRRLVAKYPGDFNARTFRCLDLDRTMGLICDQQVELTVFYSRRNFPLRLRRVRFKDPETGKTRVFLTNHFDLPALSICALYKSRWQVELFFKRIKQHLRIKRFTPPHQPVPSCPASDNRSIDV